MEQREPSGHSMFEDAEIVELVLGGLGPEPVRSLAQIAEAVVPAMSPLVRPMGIELLHRPSAHTTGSAQRWVVGVSDLPAAVQEHADERDLTIDGDQVDLDAIRLLIHRGLGSAAPPNADGTGWTELAVPWSKVLVPDDASAGDELVVDRPGPGAARLLVPIERIDGRPWVTAPVVVRNLDGGGDREIDPPIDVRWRTTTIAGEVTGVVSIEVWWSTWWAAGSAGRDMVEAVARELERAGWRRRGADAAVRLGVISTGGSRPSSAVDVSSPVATPTPPPPPRSPSPFPLGRTTDDGRYAVLETLYRFGGGLVCRGRRRDDNINVIMTIRPGGSTTPAGVLHRLGFAADSVAPLLHVGVLDDDPGHLAVVEAEPAGVPLTEVPWPLRPDAVVAVAGAVAEALDAAHGRGAIVHELRPELVYVDLSGPRLHCSGVLIRPTALLLGFLAAADGETRSYPFARTYLSPELVAGLAPSPASDVFSLSALVAHCLSGGHPFRGEGMQQLIAIHAGDRIAWTGPPAVAAILDAGLAAAPETRPSVAALLAGLRTALVPSGGHAEPQRGGLPTMQQVGAAMQAGDFAGAHQLLESSDDARTEAGIAVGAYLLAFMGRYEDADRQVGRINAPAVKTLVRGEWRRAARWAIEANASQLPTATNLPYLALYVEMAVALLRRDAALADRVKADMAVQVPKRAGRLTFVDGRTQDFDQLVDADDAIGAMLEAYVGDGVLYFPFASIRRIEFPPPRNVLDLFTPLAVVHLLDGQVASVAVPLLYARSSTSDDAALRSGRMTSFDYVGKGRRALGMRDFDAGGALVGMSRIASIDFAP